MAIGSCGCGGVAKLHPEPNADPMTEERLPLAGLLAKAGDGDFLCSVAEAVLQMRIPKLRQGSYFGLLPVRWTPR